MHGEYSEPLCVHAQDMRQQEVSGEVLTDGQANEVAGGHRCHPCCEARCGGARSRCQGRGAGEVGWLVG